MTIDKPASTCKGFSHLKERLLAMLCEALDNPLVLPDGWVTFFGDMPVLRAAHILSRLERPHDEMIVDEGEDISSAERAVVESWSGDWIESELQRRCHGYSGEYCEKCAPKS